MNFKEFITEQEEAPKGKALKHLTHIEDYTIHGGHEGVGIADEHLRNLHNMLLGKSPRGFHASTKYDGAPSVVFGIHPKTGKPFVASKSAFNKDPKINYTDEDIERNHGHAPGLVEKLKSALHNLPNILPKNGGIYQGDLMHTEGDAQTKNGKTSITPNTITYSAPSDSPEGRNMKKKLGIVVHTKYTGRGDLDNMTAQPLDEFTRSKFKEHPDVNNVNPSIEVNSSNYTPDEQKAFLNHMEKAKKVYSSMKPESMDALEGHGTNLEAHVNNMIRTGGTPSTQGYMDHLTARHMKDLEKTKTESVKQKKQQAHANVLQHISDNREHFDKTLKLHNHLQDAKNVLVKVLAKNNPYEHSVGEEPTGPEGTVLYDKNGNASKAVDRQEFSRQNFLKGAFQKNKVEEANAKLQ
ncbi:hypothetical protein UFOVP787_32 [uncultured Caudovirales phage]|uniref:Uncharacterized protein n=1 Tax=uncultured Caudovirales phage TaxID=2100421 RepID=A0A6J5NU70_9CAUD|nr:hypothetical protein UFOVP787_32 [uncultured Caudovirales phage]